MVPEPIDILPTLVYMIPLVLLVPLIPLDNMPLTALPKYLKLALSAIPAGCKPASTPP